MALSGYLSPYFGHNILASPCFICINRVYRIPSCHNIILARHFPGSQGLDVIVMAWYWGIIEVLVSTICPVTGISWPRLSLHRTHEQWLVAHMAATNITSITHVTHITNTLWQSVTHSLIVTHVLRDNPHVSSPTHHWWCPHQFPWHWWLLCRHLTLWPGPIVLVW